MSSRQDVASASRSTASSWRTGAESSRSNAAATSTAVAVQQAAAAAEVQGGQAAANSIGAGRSSAAVAEDLQPYHSVVQAVQNCQHQVLVLSGYPQQLTALALEATGLQTQAVPELQTPAGSDLGLWRISRGRQPHQQQQQYEPDKAVRNQPQQYQEPPGQEGPLQSKAPHVDQQQQQPYSKQESSSKEQPPVIQVVFSSPTKVDQVQEAVEALLRLAISGKDQAQCNSLPVKFYVGDWACRSPVLRARAACHPAASLLSESDLAEKMEVAELDVVMDGIAWRT